MKIEFLFTKSSKVTLLIFILLLCLPIILKLLIENRIQIAPLAPANAIITEERLDKDIDIILALYGLKKDLGEMIYGEGNSIYYRYYKNDNTTGKSIFINVDPIFFGSAKKYTEVETLMEIWLYVSSHRLPFEIDGITYFFTAPSELFQGLTPSKIYMSADEFSSLYQETKAEGLTHNQKIKELTKAYVAKSGYHRNPGHIQVRSN